MLLPVLLSVIRHIVLLGFIAQEFAIPDGSITAVVALAVAAVVVVVVITVLTEKDPITKLKIDDIIF